MSGSGTIWDKLALLAACACIVVAGVIMIITGAGAPKHGLIAYGVAALFIGGSGFIVALKGKPDIDVSLTPGFSINKIGGLLDVPWWLWLIDVGVLVIAAIIAQVVLA